MACGQTMNRNVYEDTVPRRDVDPPAAAVWLPSLDLGREPSRVVVYE
jgi:hypothetical protein